MGTYRRLTADVRAREMKMTAQIDAEQATPDYILDVIQDSYRQACQFDPEVEHGASLSFDTTIADWRSACDLLPWRPLSKALASWFVVDFTSEEWKSLLEPAKIKKLGPLCTAIAAKARRNRIKPITVFGKDCESAAIFLALRQMLSDAGADVSEIRPDTPLLEYTRTYPGVFLKDVSKLFPGALPDVKIAPPFCNLFTFFAFALCLILAGVGGCVASPRMAGIGATMAIFFLVAVWSFAKIRLGTVTFGAASTFRDLVTILVRNKEGRTG